MKKQNKQKGFTLVELVIVIAVIAILAGVLIPTFSGIVEKANKSAALQEAKNALTQDLVLADAEYTNIPSTKPEYALSTDDKGNVTYYEKVTVTVGNSVKDYYKMDNNNIVKCGDTDKAEENTPYYKLVDGQYQGIYDATSKTYTYTNGTYTCVYDVSNGDWTTSK